jgi:hypothetical protein
MKFMVLFIVIWLGVGCAVLKSELEELAMNGHAPSQYQMGVSLASQGDKSANNTHAVTWYRKSAVQGYVPAQYNLGYMLLHGLGVEKNSSEAFKWFFQSAESGLPKAQFNLALMYKQGIGVEQDDDRAIQWSKKKLPVRDIWKPSLILGSGMA